MPATKVIAKKDLLPAFKKGDELKSPIVPLYSTLSFPGSANRCVPSYALTDGCRVCCSTAKRSSFHTTISEERNEVAFAKVKPGAKHKRVIA